MFSTIRRHQSWLYVVIATITIASFVIYGPSGCNKANDSARGGADYGSFQGQPITASQLENARRNLRMGYFIQRGTWISNDVSGLDLEALKQVVIAHKEKDLGIQISDEAVAVEARRVLGQANFDQFVQGVLQPQGLDANDFDRFIRAQLAQRQLMEVASLTGRLVTPQEAESLYRLEHQELATSMVLFSASNFLSSVSVTPEAISDFYAKNIANYKVPDQVQVSYVKFNVTNYLAAAQAATTNLDQMVNDEFNRMGTNYLQLAKSPAEAKAMLKDDYLHNRALVDARKEAGLFAEELDKGTNRNSPAALEELAKKKGLTVQTTVPFTLRDGPQDLKVPEVFSRAAFTLTPEDPFSGTIKADDGVYVLAFKQRIPAQIPDLKSVEAKVTSAYRESQALELAQQATTKFSITLTNGLAQGKTFAAITAEAKVKPEALPPVSLRTESLPPEVEGKVDLNALKQAAFSTPVGKVSPPTRARNGAFVLYVEKQLPVDEAKMKADLPDFITSLRDSRQNEAFNEWFSAQVRQDSVFAQRLQRMMQEAQMGAARQPRS